MTDPTKKKLTALGAAKLADALLELAGTSRTADDMVSRLVATPNENRDRFKSKLAAIKRSRRFIDWGKSSGFARELWDLLADLETGVSDPVEGFKRITAFIELDDNVFGRCDDSSGHVGDVFRHDAGDMFTSFAARCTDKSIVIRTLIRLLKKDNYGVRGFLIDDAGKFLDESDIRKLIHRLRKLATEEIEEHDDIKWYRAIESLANQLKDARLFEETRRASYGVDSAHSQFDIGSAYLNAGDHETALSWLNRIQDNDSRTSDERNRLLFEIHSVRGDKAEQAKVAWRMFRRSRSAHSLDDLLSVIGQERKEQVLKEEIAIINSDNALDLTDLRFLITAGRLGEAETYLLERFDQVNGDYYQGYLPVAEDMAAFGYSLAASAVYRKLLDSILSRARSTIYPHGIRYLKILDKLATTISDWRNLQSHENYHNHLRKTHGRKTSFWSRYKNVK